MVYILILYTEFYYIVNLLFIIMIFFNTYISEYNLLNIPSTILFFYFIKSIFFVKFLVFYYFFKKNTSFLYVSSKILLFNIRRNMVYLLKK